jgi:hypothetical protein
MIFLSFSKKKNVLMPFVVENKGRAHQHQIASLQKIRPKRKFRQTDRRTKGETEKTDEKKERTERERYGSFVRKRLHTLFFTLTTNKRKRERQTLGGRKCGRMSVR